MKTRPLAALALTACGLALATAWGAEKLLGLNPCAFCLLERRPYYVGVAIAGFALILPLRAARIALWALLPVLLVGVGLSFTHVGVEQHWWPDPLPECSAPDFTGMTMSQRLARMPARPAKPCEDADFLIPGVPVSMSQMAFGYVLAISAGLAILLTGSRRRGFK